LTLGPAQRLQALPERRAVPQFLRVVRASHPYGDLSHARGLLRARGEWPRCRCAGEQGYEFAALQIVELHRSRTSQKRCRRIPNWLGSVSGLDFAARARETLPKSST
jgi:hypothetical protein